MVRPAPIEGVEPEPAPDTPGFVSRQENFLQIRGLGAAQGPTQTDLALQRLALLTEMRRRLDPPQEEQVA